MSDGQSTMNVLSSLCSAPPEDAFRAKRRKNAQPSSFIAQPSSLIAQPSSFTATAQHINEY
ncbi:MAG: hypothetical protein ACTTJD_04570 [Porphyromonadaceae bacterium]